MSVKLSLEGMDDLRKALQQLPDDMKSRATFIVTKYAYAAKQQIQGAYPVFTGNLANHVTQTNNAANRATTTAIVKSTAKHASIFEYGTVNRRSRKGNRGRMPPANPAQAMIPKVIRLRAQMTNELIELVKEAGFEVSAS